MEKILTEFRLITQRNLVKKNKVKTIHHCAKYVRIRSFSGPHFPAFGLNTKIYRVILRVQDKFGKMRTRKTPNTDTFYAAHIEPSQCDFFRETEKLTPVNSTVDIKIYAFYITVLKYICFILHKKIHFHIESFLLNLIISHKASMLSIKNIGIILNIVSVLKENNLELFTFEE